jgi:pimeloyl-ACP methyl ester carboxylesterase
MLDWGSCDSTLPPEAQCATLDVPIDHKESNGATVSIALVRLAARDREDRRGSIVFNPGGPGASGVDMVGGLAGQSSQVAAMREHFDLIGFDPRGVGRSQPVDCVDDVVQENSDAHDDGLTVPPEADLSNADVANRCKQRMGALFGKVSTDDVVADLELIRQALGDDQLTFYGASYGTYLGASYAETYPDKTRAMVLDGAFAPTGTTVDDDTQTIGFEKAFGRWADWCKDSPLCKFSVPDVVARWEALQAALVATPLSVDGRNVSRSTFMQATKSALYASVLWPFLGDALAHAEQGDGTGLLQLRDMYYERNSDGTYGSIGEAFRVISCNSGFFATGATDDEQRNARMSELAPHFFDPAESSGDPCEGLPTGMVNDAFDYAGEAPILVIGGLNDPATPYTWATEMAAELGDRATLVTYAGDGHATWLEGSSCIDHYVDMALVDAVVPSDNVECAASQPLAAPDYLSTIAPFADKTSVDLTIIAPAFGIDLATTYLAGYFVDGTPDLTTVLNEYRTALGTEWKLASEFTTGAAWQHGETTMLTVDVFAAAGLADSPVLAALIPDGKTLVLISATA